MSVSAYGGSTYRRMESIRDKTRGEAVVFEIDGNKSNDYARAVTRRSARRFTLGKRDWIDSGDKSLGP